MHESHSNRLNTFYMFVSVLQNVIKNGEIDVGADEGKKKYVRTEDWTYHPSGRVRVNPNCGSVATETLIPVRPLESGVITRPRITDTRLFRRQDTI